MSLKEVLQNIGLSAYEAEAYLILLKKGRMSATSLAKHVQISRPNVYDLLERLLEKGVVSYTVEHGKKIFQPVEPKRLLEYLNTREVALKLQKDTFLQLLPEFQKLFSIPVDKPYVEIFEGKEGIKHIFKDMIVVGTEMVAFNTLGEELYEYVPKYELDNYFKARKRKQMRSRQFYNEGNKIIRHPFAVYKKIPKQYNQTSLFVYGDRIVMFILASNPIVIKIVSKEVAQLYYDRFELMWKQI